MQHTDNISILDSANGSCHEQLSMSFHILPLLQVCHQHLVFQHVSNSFKLSLINVNVVTSFNFLQDNVFKASLSISQL